MFLGRRMDTRSPKSTVSRRDSSCGRRPGSPSGKRPHLPASPRPGAEFGRTNAWQRLSYALEYRRSDLCVSDLAFSNDDGTAGAVVLDEVRRRLACSLDSRAMELPLLPGVAAEVIAGSLDDHDDPTRLAQLIQTEQGLASHVLRVVNSPALRAAMEIVAL